MLPRNRSLRCSLVAGLAAMAALPATLPAASSPFLPPQASGPAAPTQNAPLEYGGFLTTPEGPLYRIRDPQKKTGAFLKLNERDPTLDVVVKQHDPNGNTVTIEHQGRTLTLEERVAKIVSSGNAAMSMPPPPQPAVPNVAPAVTQSVVVNPTPADEQKRLEAVAAEVQRRRALREQAQQQMGQQGTQGNVVQPQPMPQPAVPQLQQQQMQGGQPRGGTNVRPQSR